MGRMRIAWIIVGLACSAGALAADAPPCTVCHADLAAGEHAHPLAAAAEGGPACGDCHRGADAHAAAPGSADALAGMVRFGEGAPAGRRAACLGCHGDVHDTPGRDAHAQAGIACDDCHRVHGDAPLVGTDAPAVTGFHRADAASRSCAACHADVLTDFAFNERHRLAEGGISCTDCHDPHAAQPAPGLAHPGDGPCGACHVDKTGPFVFEHDAVRIEGCQACHDAHGSPNRFLLTHQQEGALCYTCHLSVPQFHVGFAPGAPPRFDENTLCTNCHTAIHGSNLDAGLLR
jgi:DmsE family decaheme c-type cytochrome